MKTERNSRINVGARFKKGLIDLSARSGYSLVGSKPMTHTEQTTEYYLFDWEYAQTPEQSSWIAASLVCFKSFIFSHSSDWNIHYLE